MLRILLLLVALTTPAQSEEVVAGLSQNTISISTNFDGSEILIFGAVKREQQIDRDSDLGVIVTVAGPRQSLTVRRKDKWAIIWVNQDSLEVQSAPSFYAIATSAPFSDMISDEADQQHLISVDRAISAGVASEGVIDKDNFTEALIRIRSKANLYQMNESSVALRADTLFNTSIALPANLVAGNYTVRFLLTRDQQVVSQYETAIFVNKVGLERFLYSLAHEQPIWYGLMSLAIAIAAGWGAAAVFRYIRS
ncbi:TIGR02186 family protein [Oceaniglobus ichthyenteri]|uniref:TIGR02186 family protein n=1 Tax=Oceaniglobus ichthyenteri TaxID=2136177 RepID=UPI000D3D8897|nr:TIGR02186 family protein [Oceaniglobus ichthyenteri]